MGQDPALPADTLLLGDGDAGSPTSASQRFYRVLHAAASAGEHEKVVQVPVLPQNPCLGAACSGPGLCPCPCRPSRVAGEVLCGC